MATMVRRGLGLAVAGALLLGCGGDDDGAATAAAGGATTTEAPASGDDAPASDLFTQDPELCELYPVGEFAAFLGNAEVVAEESTFFPDEDGSRGQADAYCFYRVNEDAQVPSGSIFLEAYRTVDAEIAGLQVHGQYDSDRVALAGFGDEAFTFHGGQHATTRIGTVVLGASWGDYVMSAPGAPPVEQLLAEVLAALEPVLP